MSSHRLIAKNQNPIHSQSRILVFLQSVDVWLLMPVGSGLIYGFV